MRPTSMIVTATFAQPNKEQSILSIRAGRNGVLSGGERIRRELGEGLYQRILDRAYAYSVIEPATPVTTTSTPSGMSTLTFWRLCVRAPRTFITPDEVRTDDFSEARSLR